MPQPETTPLTPEAMQDLRERWINDIGGAMGSLALFVTSVVINNDGSPRAMGVSGLCLIAGANFIGGAFDKGRQLAQQTNLVD